MLDFLKISTHVTKQGDVEIYPDFIIDKTNDLMIRGRDFYAIWVEERGLWSTDENDALRLIDAALDGWAKKNEERLDGRGRVLHMRRAASGMIDRWHKYCQKQMRDSYHMLDEKLIFANTETKKKDYASKKLPYPLENGEPTAWNKLLSVLYSEEERQKIEWAIGSVVAGDSVRLQKFVVFYGAAGTGKSTIINIIQQLFEGYWSVFDAKALGSSNNSFALEAFRKNPLVAIQHDGDLSKIEDNTRLNSVVSHEDMSVNEKFKSTYENRFKCFLFMGTNKPVKITDAKSGLIRRLIDVTPTGEKLDGKEYRALMKQIGFELGAIANHCKEVYLENPGRYDDYVPLGMLGASNDFYNFITDAWYVFQRENETTLKAAWEMYKTYCDDAKVAYPYSLRPFKEELKNYFAEYKERDTLPDGTRIRNHYKGFRTDKFENKLEQQPEETESPAWLVLKKQKSLFDEVCADCPAQYGNDSGKPMQIWAETQSLLCDLDTEKLHYVKPPLNHIVIDFDISDESGNKSLEKNLEEASKWPPTYAETSKSGAGVHLHYLYSGDPNTLSRVYGDHIEVKVWVGDSSLRRKLTLCNDLPIATISHGLPVKEEKKIVDLEGINNEKSLRTVIKRNLNKEYHADTNSSVNFIHKVLEDMYKSGASYDVSDMENAVTAFAAGSTNHANDCLRKVSKMKFKSDSPSPAKESDGKLVFYDVEVFPNLFLVNWKVEGEGKPVIRMINPSPTQITELMKLKLVGFNCRRYDNHLLYARLNGYTNEQLYKLSQRIIGGERDCFFGEAYNVSYTDVYDFSSKKQSLKKFEIELGIHHQELGLPWDQPVPEDQWTKVAEYCDNDVIATEAVFNARKSDFLARQILADVAGMSVNDTTNSLTTRIIFGKERKPQERFRYRNLALPVTGDALGDRLFNPAGEPLYEEWLPFDPIPEGYSNQPFFPGYVFDKGESTYRGEEVGEGGYVYAEPGMYGNVALLDIASMHPSSIVAERLFGDEYTKRFQEILNARIAIKHKEYDTARTLLGGKLQKYLEDESIIGDLAQALKIAINSVYGLTSATFDNPFRDKRNVDNIVAKRGALFMINLKHAVQSRGYRVAHIKTDSIKIPDATPEIIQFVVDYGKEYGYNFEHEATYDRMCLVNDAVYIAKYATIEHCCELYGKEYVESSRDMLKDCKKYPDKWTATGTQFAVPYVFKKLFTREVIGFNDLCETKSVSSALYLDRNEGLAEGEHNYQFIGKVGRFCPIAPGYGGGVLLRETTSKTGEKGYAAATGSKGYRWLESEETLKRAKEMEAAGFEVTGVLHFPNGGELPVVDGNATPLDVLIDRRYYDSQVDEAVKSLSEYGDSEWFLSDDPYIPVEHPEDRPPWA